MKVKNDYVEIKMGNKIYKKQNMILNIYINRLFASQLNTTHDLANITYCYLKFDEPINNVDYDTVLNGSTDFDVVLISSYHFVKIISSASNNIKIKFSFDDSWFRYQNKYYTSNDFGMFNGRKITAIGFGHGNICFAFLDTSNMNIVVNGNEKIMITRVDNFQSDGICKGFDYPLHLINDMAFIDYDDNTGFSTKAQLYSIGFGNTEGLMEEEYLVDNVETDRDNTSITFNVNRTKKLGHYPSEDLHFTFYPTMDNSKYLIFKYRLYYGSDSLYQYFDKYYTMSVKNEDFNNLEIKLKIERL